MMQKQNHRIVTVPCGYSQFELMSKGGLKDFFPVVLKAEVLTACGFSENKDYALLPTARQFILVLPVNGSQQHSIHAFIKSNGECFARAMQENNASSNPVYHLHQLQNLYYALTGEEMGIILNFKF